MVRNPRMLLMCGALVAATGLALGGRAPVPAGDLALPSLWSLLVPGLGLWTLKDFDAWRASAAPSPRVPSMTPDRPFDDGARRPRQPRQSREADVRAMR